MNIFKISGSSLLGAGLGWWFAGPVGAVLGFVLGSFAEGVSGELATENRTEGNPRDGFVASLLVLIAAVMKADGKIVKSELDFVKAYLRQAFNEEKASEALLMLREILERDIPLQQVCRQISANVDYNSKVQLVHMLFGVANADGAIPASEQDVIRLIASGLGLSTRDFESVMNMYVKSTESAYKILEVDPAASNDEIKKAYRKMAVKFHPDKVAHLGEEFQASANEKFQKVNEAFETIKKQRGFN
ncbi:TerB family tellurite resistance protein [Saccharicrinis fermentans]|uniref:DnaJ-like protein DjlA n=1 Tax=Saccharicrinis fermentans DSM 9555 = JCM 21142 TaxID=869213 RepID=W7YF32_9BACT|nr:TerB family tellurite resistance protein [Saccharicrinis fermentans]GAF03056.1 DnaJ-like protein DjlA [Saccharicrinis fermentans DSM 9555 = JCM 21142]